ncbi:MAG TPA: methyltransferase domain-containing protein [Vicinamibacterales bacterium]|nr:methyltransferase domain-containing protein [Vicinamibacterales bacterium]
MGAARALDDADRARLQRERADADRRYNDALTALDALADAPTTPLLSPVPALDEAVVATINERWHILATPPQFGAGWRGRLGRFVWRIVGPALDRQQIFNATLVEHLNRNIEAERRARETVNETLALIAGEQADARRFRSQLVQYLQQITAFVDTRDREAASAILTDPHEQIRRLESALGLMQQQIAVLKREVERQLETPDARTSDSRAQPSATAATSGAGSSRLNAYKYVGFEREFRGAPEAIQERLAAYAPYFEGARDVLDIGCGRGEFLELLRARGIPARGLELNHEMAEVSRARGLDVTEGDAVGYLESLPDGSLGGLFAAQVVEHLEPDYLMRFLELAYHRLRPGSKIVLETINVDSWSAFFGPYLKDITHVRPLPSDTLLYLLRASGFQRVDMRASAPMGDEHKLARLSIDAANGPGAAAVTAAFNQNVDRLNALLFGFSDYAAIGERL